MEASDLVRRGVAVVLVGKDAEALGQAARNAPDGPERERLLAVMVGDLDDPAVRAAAEEMAREMWPWAGERP